MVGTSPNEIFRFSLAGLGLATAGSLYDNSRFQYNGRLNRYSRQNGYRRYDYEVSSDWFILSVELKVDGPTSISKDRPSIFGRHKLWLGIFTLKMTFWPHSTWGVIFLGSRLNLPVIIMDALKIFRPHEGNFGHFSFQFFFQVSVAENIIDFVNDPGSNDVTMTSSSIWKFLIILNRNIGLENFENQRAWYW